MAKQVLDVVFAAHSMPPSIWDESKTRIKWVSLKNYDMRTMTDTIKAAIKDQTQPKNIIISCYQRFAGAVENEKLCGFFDEIVLEFKSQTANRICLATCMFLPNSSAVWDKVANLNESIRIYNNVIGISPCNLHKMCMTTVSEEDLTLRLKGGCFAEFQLGLNFGINLSIEGLIRVKQHVINVFDFAFKEPQTEILQAIKKGVRINKPPPLIETPGYNFNRFFLQELKARNLAYGCSDNGEIRRHLSYSKWRPEGWKHWAVYKNDLLWTKQDREKALQEHLDMLHRSDEPPVWGDIEEEKEVIIVEFDNDEYQAEDRDIHFVEDKEDTTMDSKSQKTKEEDSNENEVSVVDTERAKAVNGELARNYKIELSLAKVQVSKEKAAAREWKRQANILERDNKELNEAVDKYAKRIDVLEAQVSRMIKEYKFLRGLYEDGGRRRGVKVHGKAFAKERDFKENPKDKC